MTQPGSGPVDARGTAGEGQSTGARSAGSRPCPGCGTPVNVNASVCPTCGESLPSRNKKIRCRQCHGTASANLVICPHCGRELQPAAPRLLTWGVPALLVLLFGAIFLARLGGANPITWTQARVERAVAFVGSLGDRLQPEITVETIPVEEDIEDQLASAPAPALAVNDAGQAQPPADAAQPTAAPEEAAAVPPTETATATTEPTATTAPTATEAPTATAAPELPTATATATSVPPTATSLPATATTTVTLSVRATASPTATARGTVLAAAASATVTATGITSQSLAAALLVLPTPTPTVAVPTPTPQLYTVRVGDTLFELALANDISLDLLLAANGLTADDVYTIQPGDTLIIPDPNATPPATATPVPTATSTPVAGSTYTVQAGDTLMAIALRNRVTTQALLDANGLTLAEARTLRPGQELIIPGSSQPTATPAATATTAAAAPPSSGATAGIRLDTPSLRTPENNTVVSCNRTEALAWNAVPFIQASDLYLVHLGYVNGAPAGGNEEVVWVLEQQRPSAATSWELDESLCGLAPFEFGRQWRWYVEVVERAADGKLNPVSEPSSVWGFSWQ
ncbi:MAG TPA: LysM peptidoglycan-binding domain-containing protein [Caldilinea sp.]|nr:LysM peptidoglycan-binding domain-containing protein [Caldilinea sp.]